MWIGYVTLTTVARVGGARFFTGGVQPAWIVITSYPVL